MAYPRAKVETSTRGAVATGKVTPVMARSLRSWLTGVLKVVRDDVRGFAPADLGAFRRSVIYRTRQSGVEVSGEVFSTDKPTAKVAVIEYGRRPNKPMPPAGALLGWMARHGIPADREFLVRRKIGRDGIPGRFPFRKAFTKRKGLLQSQARYLQSTLTRDLNG